MPFDLDLAFGGKRYKNAQRGLEIMGATLEKNVKDFNPVIKKELRDLLDTVIAAMQQRHSTPWSPGQKLPKGDRTGKLAKRSGKLMRSLRGTVKGSGDNSYGELTGSGLLEVHEEGRTIRPKRKKYLAVPLPAALTTRGTPKKRKPRDWKNTFVAKSRKGNLLIFQRMRGKGKIRPLYWLTTEVRIPARLGAVLTAETALPVFEDRLFEKLVRELLKQPGQQ